MKLGAAPVVVAVALAGCSSILPKAPAKMYYDLEYDPRPVDCAHSYAAPVEVWSFPAAGPYDRSDMVVTDGREVSFARGHQWVDRPGELVAQRLRRDLGAGRLFPLAVSPRDPEGASLQLTGDLYRFALEKDGGSARARLEADVVLRATGHGARVLMHERYDVRSDPVTRADDASVFARAMSGVMARFSTLVRRDLCAAIEASSPRAGTTGSTLGLIGFGGEVDE